MSASAERKNALTALFSDPDQLPAATRHFGFSLIDLDPDQHWVEMLQEVRADVKLGRMRGPFQAPENGASRRWRHQPQKTVNKKNFSLHLLNHLRLLWDSRSVKLGRMVERKSGVETIGAEASKMPERVYMTNQVTTYWR